jgi:hypothetical protein
MSARMHAVATTAISMKGQGTAVWRRLVVVPVPRRVATRGVTADAVLAPRTTTPPATAPTIDHVDHGGEILSGGSDESIFISSAFSVKKNRATRRRVAKRNGKRVCSMAAIAIRRSTRSRVGGTSFAVSRILRAAKNMSR